MIKRFAAVIWWICTLLGIIIIGTYVFGGGSARPGEAISGGIGCYLFGCVVSYILSGSFWRPPKP